MEDEKEVVRNEEEVLGVEDEGEAVGLLRRLWRSRRRLWGRLLCLERKIW